MTEMTLEQLQERVWSVIESRGMGTSIDVRIDKFEKEVSELFDAVVRYEQADEADKPRMVAAIAEECADVRMTLLALERSMRITNPTEITLAKIEDTEERYGRKG